MDFKLSICIPTFNRARFLAETIENVILQANDYVEIIIVDGASTDNTTEIVNKYKQKFKNIVYYRGDEKKGVDKDMAKTIELARGEYCWMLSDDDLLQLGAINRVLKEIESKCEIYLCNIKACNLQMKPYQDVFWLSRKVGDRVFLLHDKNEFIQYCNYANSIGALFSYMSSIIIKRDAWNKTGFHNDFNDTAYALASSLLSFVKTKCRLKYIRDNLVLWRNDNESCFYADGLIKRFLLDFDGYLRLANKYLSDDKEIRDAFLKVMTREHPWYTIINVSSFFNSIEEWMPFRDKMLKFGYSPGMINICYSLGRFKPLVSMAVRIKRKVIRCFVRAKK